MLKFSTNPWMVARGLMIPTIVHFPPTDMNNTSVGKTAGLQHAVTVVTGDGNKEVRRSTESMEVRRESLLRKVTCPRRWTGRRINGDGPSSC
jgi:hypothetical protein